MQRQLQVKYKNRGNKMKAATCTEIAVSEDLMPQISDCQQLMLHGQIPVVTFLLPTSAVFC
jgi:hypothetical protein